ncbi:MAG: Ribose ABC transport system, permease protein RbsC, partial [uncultured Thermomicrobiales bacterium]
GERRPNPNRRRRGDRPGRAGPVAANRDRSGTNLRHPRGAAGPDPLQRDRQRQHVPRLGRRHDQPDPGGDHRHRRGRDDLGGRDRGNRPLGRGPDGDQRRNLGADPAQHPVSLRCPVLGWHPRLRDPGPGRGRVRSVQRLAGDRLPDPADHRHPDPVSGRARHRPGPDRWQAQSLQGAGLAVPWAGSPVGDPVSGDRDAADRRRRGLGDARDRVRPLRPGDRRQRGGGALGRRAGDAGQARGLRHQRPPGRTRRVDRDRDQWLGRRQPDRREHGTERDRRGRRRRHFPDGRSGDNPRHPGRRAVHPTGALHPADRRGRRRGRPRDHGRHDHRRGPLAAAARRL